MKTVMVRYKTSSPETSDANAALVRAVFEELREKTPSGIRYASYRMEDGLTFVHIATHLVSNTGSSEALTSLPSFKAFQKELKSRCAEPPVVTELSPVGAYEGLR